MKLRNEPLERIVIFASSFLDEPIHQSNKDKAIDLLNSLNGYQIEFRCDRDYRKPLQGSEFQDVVATIADAEIYDKRILKEVGVGTGGNLQLISRYGVGVDYVDLDSATKYGVIVTNCPGCNSIPAAEWTLSTILDVAGKRIHNHELASIGRTKKDSSRQDISGKILGVIGTGNVGKELVRLMSGFGVKIIAYTTHPDLEWAEEFNVEYYDHPDKVYKNADVITLHATPKDNRALIGERELGLMKSSAILVNCARPYLVDEVAVYQAVKSRRLFGYGGDNTWTREDLPLRGLNIVTSPHIGADSDLGKGGMRTMSTRAVVDFLSGKLPKHIVNKEVLKHERWKGKMYS